VAPSIAPNGTLSFAPALNANGAATVVVQLHDNGGVGLSGADTSGSQTFLITVSAVNDSPVAVGESYNAISNDTLSVPVKGVLANDTDVEGDTLAAQLISAPMHGSLTLNADGSFVYSPAPGYGGADSFSYVANDGNLASNIAIVNFNITGVNSAPVANSDSFTTSEDVTLIRALPGILFNDTDAEADSLTATLVTPTAHGSLVLNVDGSFTYVPALNFNGVDGFTYSASDGRLGSNIASVVLNVIAVNLAPVAANDSYSAMEDIPLNIASPGLVGNDTDVEGSTLQALRLAGPTHGTLTMGVNGAFQYLPALNFNGTDSFTYKANDGLLDHRAQPHFRIDDGVTTG
jgi:VCBS repeat-containing protein